MRALTARSQTVQVSTQVPAQRALVETHYCMQRAMRLYKALVNYDARNVVSTSSTALCHKHSYEQHKITLHESGNGPATSTWQTDSLRIGTYTPGPLLLTRPTVWVETLTTHEFVPSYYHFVRVVPAATSCRAMNRAVLQVSVDFEDAVNAWPNPPHVWHVPSPMCLAVGQGRQYFCFAFCCNELGLHKASALPCHITVYHKLSIMITLRTLHIIYMFY